MKIDFVITSKTETTITIQWTSTVPLRYVTCSFFLGTSDTGKTEIMYKHATTPAYSGTYTLSWLNAGAEYRLIVRGYTSSSPVGTSYPSTNKYVTTYRYPYCTSSPDFEIGDPLTLKFYNPLGRLITVEFIALTTGGTGGSLSSDETAMTTLTGYNTDTFIEKLYNSIPNSTSAKYRIRVTYNGVSYDRDNNNTYSVKESECSPIFTDFEYEDTTPYTNAITKNDFLIKEKSWLKVNISSTNKMVTRKGATPDGYKITIDTLNLWSGYSDYDLPVQMGKIVNSGTLRLTVTAYDSRGLGTSVYKDVAVLEYTKPVVNVTASRLNNFEAQTTIKIDGTYEPYMVDSEERNTIRHVLYRYREVGRSFGDDLYAIVNTNNGRFTCNDVVLELDNDKEFEIEIYAVDKIDRGSNSTTVDVGKAIFFISSNEKKCYINDKEVLPVDLIYPVGTIYMSMNNVDPSTLFGGTWEQLQDMFLLGAGLNYEVGTTGGSATHTLTVDEMPSHNHSPEYSTDGGSSFTGASFGRSVGDFEDSGYMGVTNGIKAHSIWQARIGYKGGNQPHNNMPPYLAVYMWKRTA